MPDDATDDLIYHNPGRRLLRGGLAGGAVCVGYAALGAAILYSGRLPTREGAGLFWAVTSVLAGAIAPVMFLVALLARFVARAGDRAFARFRSGQVLADWRFSPDEWEAFLATEQARRRQVRWQLGWLGVVVPLGIFGLILTSVVARGVGTGIACVAGTVAATALALGLAKAVADGFDRRYLARMRRSRRVLIGRGALYCGGGLTLWDVNMTVLQRIRAIPGRPQQLELTIGPNRALQAVDMVAGVAAVAGGGGGGGGGTPTQVRVPVPAGHEGEAAALVNLLLPPPAMAHGAAPVSAGLRPAPAPPARLPTRRVSWWAIAGGLWVVGLALFLLAPRAPGGGGQDYTGLGTAMCIGGLFLWIFSLVAAILAGLRMMRHHSVARH